ncbi:MAG: GNAT family N-acetyltransferase [Saprospiraceae bacterium]|nr:GNAT family N-acetyltransferase [Saprospiraceae bacterium]MCB0542929.1 GNAT family N-acetyltransferase [Saprospiraceae bacterium]MCB9353195.1 GNAT family N-acetyltransferase [Lewinellaceae bacterium]
MDLRIKKLTADDIPLLQYVGRATYEPYYRHIWKPGGLDWYMEYCFGAKVLGPALADPGVEYLLAGDAEGAIVGFMKIVLQKPVPHTGILNALYLEKIYLMPDFFGKGAGQELLKWVVAEKAVPPGREAVWLEVMQSGPVRAYERAGFENIGPAYFGHELLIEHERDGWVMLKRL